MRRASSRRPPANACSLPPADPREAAPLPFDGVLLAAGVNVAARSIWRGLFGWKRYDGSVEAICRAVLEDCWTGQVLRRVGGALPAVLDARSRDVHAGAVQPRLPRARGLVVGMGARAVRARGAHDARRSSTGASPRDVYAYACDSLPLTLFALRAADCDYLIDRHRELFRP